MDEIPLYPFNAWTPEERQALMDKIPLMPDQDLKAVADSVSEGLADLPAEMQAHYRAMKAELWRRREGIR